MSKIYRLHKGATDSVRDWAQLSSYLDAAQIDTIPDPAGANTRSQITSIPSPFARIDLVKTAFKQIVSSKEPVGTSIFHKMVSDALDVGEVFFNRATLSDKIELIAWDPGLRPVGDKLTLSESSDLNELVQSRSSGHKLCGQTLKMFFSQDAGEYNFDHLQRFYLLNYRSGKDMLNMIGGTSPATLFFSSANDFEYVSLNFGNDRLFDAEYCPLFRRNDDYILFFYSLREALPGFRTRFQVIDQYLDLCFAHLSDAMKERVRAISANTYEQEFVSVPLAGSGNVPEVLGFELRGIKSKEDKPQQESDFVIAATQKVDGFQPLVLPSYTFNGNLRYVDTSWNAAVKAPYEDLSPLTERTLPGIVVRYPYLTISDFLEPYLIRLPFQPDASRFYTGNLPRGGNEGYLLPVSPLFFRYFRSEDLYGIMPDGKPMFEFIKLAAGAIKVRLRIPVRNGSVIDMERIYENDLTHGATTEPDPSRNKGVIRDLQISLAIYPFVRCGTDRHAAYTVMLLDRNRSYSNQRSCQLQYFRNDAPGQALKVRAQRQKSQKQRDGLDTIFDVVLSEFDVIVAENGKMRGCLIPLFPTKSLSTGHTQFSFAVDFGTTNTHIEYSVDGALAKPFDITDDDQQLGTLHQSDAETYNHLASGQMGLGGTLLLEQVPPEMMPDQVGGHSSYRFPRRTAVSEPYDLNLNNDTYPFADFTICWQFGNSVLAKQLRHHTNLKWGNFSDTSGMKKRIEGYIGNIVLLLRNKVVLNGGDLSATKIVWFYPSSMSNARLNAFEKIWVEMVEQYMGKGISLNKIPESVAPYYYFRKHEAAVAGPHPIINIDIGGGTTDVVVYRGEQIASYTSFKFAGNALFGDGYNGNASANGFVQFFERYYRGSLEQTPLAMFLPPAGNGEKSEEIITALFGLQHHPQRGEVSFSFTEKLRETEELKVVPLLFISSIFYHVAQYLKAKQESTPRYISFSGTASKMLEILDAGRDYKSITRLARHIFADVLGTGTVQIDLKFPSASGPKEVTAKGGLEHMTPEQLPKSVLFGTEPLLGAQKPTYSDVAETSVRDAVLQDVRGFIESFFRWASEIDFSNEFAINTRRFASFRETLMSDLDIFLAEGITEQKKEMNKQDTDVMDETMFFMPLRGVFNKLAFKIINE